MFSTLAHSLAGDKGGKNWDQPTSVPPHRLVMQCFEKSPTPMAILTPTKSFVARNDSFKARFGSFETLDDLQQELFSKAHKNEALAAAAQGFKITPLEDGFQLLTLEARSSATAQNHLLNFVSDAFSWFVFDPEGPLLWTNPAAEASVRQKRGFDFHQLFSEHGESIEQFWRSCQTLKSIVIEGEKGGQGFLIRGAQSLHLMVFGDCEFSLSSGPHLQFEKLKSMGELAGGVAHDFNNYLTAIIGFCDLLLMQTASQDKLQQDVNQIKQNASKAATLVKQLLAFSRQQSIQPKPIQLNSHIESLLPRWERMLGPKIQCSLQSGLENPHVKIDPAQLEDCLTSLIADARERLRGFSYGKLSLKVGTGVVPSKTLTRSLVQGQMAAVIQIEDSGLVIPEEDLSHIFDPFFTSHKLGKQGLGLATVFGNVQQMQGGIHVASSADQGTTFTLYLPLINTQQETPQIPTTSPEAQAEEDLHKSDPQKESATILFVEDEDAVRLFGARALRNQGHKVIEAQNGQEALDFLKTNSHQVDLVITDVVMPQMDGPTLVKHIRQTSPELKVIFISGYAEEAFRKDLGENQDLIFLPKPFSLKALSSIVHETLGDQCQAAVL